MKVVASEPVPAEAIDAVGRVLAEVRYERRTDGRWDVEFVFEPPRSCRDKDADPPSPR